MSPITFNVNDFVNNLELLPKDKSVVGLMRHAERHSFPKGSFGNHVSLSKKGKLDCQLVSSFLSNRLSSMYTSPVSRCMQTAKLLVENNHHIKIFKSHLLGDPGVFIQDQDLASSYCLMHEPMHIVERLVSCEPNPEGFFEETRTAVQRLIKMMFLKSKNKIGLSFFISHDAILGPVLGTIFPEGSVESLWPHYLECVFFWREAEYIQIVYRKLHRRILWKDLFLS